MLAYLTMCGDYIRLLRYDFSGSEVCIFHVNLAARQNPELVLYGKSLISVKLFCMTTSRRTLRAKYKRTKEVHGYAPIPKVRHMVR